MARKMIDRVDLWSYLPSHLRAVGPTSFPSLLSWAFEQVPGVTQANVEESVRQWILEARDRGVVTVEYTDTCRVIHLKTK